MARSSGLLVTVMLPWVNCWLIAAIWVPMPTWVLPPPSDAAKTSAKAVVADLKPTVPELAMLLPTESSALADALSPLNPC